MSFNEHTPDPLGRADKIRVLRDYARRYPRRTLIETGLYNGSGSGMEMLDLVRDYHAIDTTAGNITAAKDRCPSGTFWYGDSAEHLPVILASLDHPCLFWLDAHYWQAEEWTAEQVGSPVLAEIAAIRAWPYARGSVILIDDVRQFAGQPFAQPGWPVLGEVIGALLPMWQVAVEADIIRAVPC